MKKVFQVVEAITPVANEIYDKESLDVVEIGNPSNRVIAAPQEFKLGELLTEEDFSYENRTYQDHDGSNEISGVFAVRRAKRRSYTEMLADIYSVSLEYILYNIGSRPEFVFEPYPFDEDGGIKESVYDDLPRGNVVSKHGYYQEFAITSVYADENGQPMYRGLGVGDSWNEEFHSTALELDEFTIAQIADAMYEIINNKNK